MSFAKVVLWLVGLITLAFGALSLVAPQKIAELTQFGLLSAGAITEVRAFYGGVELGLAAFWIAGAIKPTLMRGALVSMVLVWGAVVFSRAAGIVLDGSFNATMGVVLGIEILSAVLAYVALTRLPANQ
ncbi:MAG: DUF4345 domain-containing protein [Pseudomonadota bacterium]